MRTVVSTLFNFKIPEGVTNDEVINTAVQEVLEFGGVLQKSKRSPQKTSARRTAYRCQNNALRLTLLGKLGNGDNDVDL